MKTSIKAALCILLCGGLASCSDWFDVSPKTDIKAEELFETESGFQNALIGIYVLMTNSNTYGANYTFGFMDRLAQRYDKHHLANPTDEDRAVIYDYVNNNNTYNSKDALESIWMGSYTVIANANNLMSWLDKNGDRVINSKQTRDHIRGEALALRALLHFDLLRSWGPCYRSDSMSLSIPYRLVADNRKLPRLRANEVMSKIVADLKAAEDLLIDQQDLNLGSAMNKSLRFRMTVHTVRGLLARVCNYRNDKKEAVRYANMVIDHCGLELVTNNTEDPAMFAETVFALSYYDMTDKLKSEFAEGPSFVSQNFITTPVLSELFEANTIGANDIRYRNAYGFLHYPDKQQAIVRKYMKSQNSMPLIRLAEMYYILCESLPLEQSAQWIDFVRNKRGISNTNNYGTFASEQSRLGALNLEYRKEFYAEGQYFFFLKIHEMETFFRCPVAQMSVKEYIFPMTDNEKEYGWTDEGSDAE